MNKRTAHGVLVILCAFVLSESSLAAAKVKLHGYVTARPDPNTLQILDDRIQISESTHFDLQNSSQAGAKPITLPEVAPGVLIEAEGRWTDRHQFAAEKITCDAEQFERELHGHAYLQTEPSEANAIAGNQPARLKADGELLAIDDRTKRNWKPGGSPTVQPDSPREDTSPRFVGDEVRYAGVRAGDGTIAVEHIELGERPPAGAYRIPGDRRFLRGHDPQTN